MESQPGLFGDEPDFFSDTFEIDSNSLMQLGWIRALLDLPGIGPKRAMTIIQQVKTADSLLTLSPKELQKLVRFDLEIPKGFSPILNDLPEHVRMVGYFDNDFPIQFRELSDPPLAIWYRGELPTSKKLTVVGTRHPTDWGVKVAAAAGEISASLGVTTVSGLALGIDVAAHISSLNHGGKTVAIIGSGLDRVTPRTHLSIAEEIVESGGCLLSESPLGTEPTAGTLVSRNRLQAALGQALLMVQCGIPSGTLHTVKFARKLGRPIAVPNPPSSDNSGANAGNAALLSQSLVANKLLGNLALPVSEQDSASRLADREIKGIEDLRLFIQGL